MLSYIAQLQSSLYLLSDFTLLCPLDPISNTISNTISNIFTTHPTDPAHDLNIAKSNSQCSFLIQLKMAVLTQETLGVFPYYWIFFFSLLTDPPLSLSDWLLLFSVFSKCSYDPLWALGLLIFLHLILLFFLQSPTLFIPVLLPHLPFPLLILHILPR